MKVNVVKYDFFSRHLKLSVKLFIQQQRLKQMASNSPASSSNSNEPTVKSSASALTSPTRPSDQQTAASPLSDDLFTVAASQPAFGTNAASHSAFNSHSASLEPLFGGASTSTAPATFGSNATGDAMFGSNSFGANSSLFAPAPTSNPFVAPPQPVMVMPQAASWAGPMGGGQGL